MVDIYNILKQHESIISSLYSMSTEIYDVALEIVSRIKLGGKVIWIGNGGSAADCQHFSAELVGKFYKERYSIPSIALSSDNAIITALSNDYDYSIIFARQIESICSSKDIVIGITTSGSSKCIIKGIERSKELGIFTIGITGLGGQEFSLMCDKSILIPSNITPRIQEIYMIICHILCEIIEYEISS